MSERHSPPITEGPQALANAEQDPCQARHPFILNGDGEFIGCELRAGHPGAHQRELRSIVHFWGNDTAQAAPRPG